MNRKLLAILLAGGVALGFGVLLLVVADDASPEPKKKPKPALQPEPEPEPPPATKPPKAKPKD